MKPLTRYNQRIYRSFDDLPSQFERLLNDKAVTFDQTAHWLRVFCGSQLTSRESLLIIAIDDCDENIPLAVLPLIQERGRFGKNSSIRALSNYYSAHFAPVFNDSVDPQSVVDVLCYSILDNVENLSQIDLNPLDRNSGLLECFQNSLERHGFATHQYYRFGRWYTRIGDSNFDSYLQSLPSALRNTIQRKQRQLNRLPNFRIEITGAQDDIRGALESYHRVYSQSWKQPEGDRQFIDAIASVFQQKDWFLLGLAYVEEQPIAAQIWFVRDHVASIFKMAYDRRFARYSPGSTLTLEMMRHAISRLHVSLVDFLIGDEKFKRDWMSMRTERWGIRARRRYSIRRTSSSSASQLCVAPGETAHDSDRVPAVLVGLCSHGLSIARSLGSNGIELYALEQNHQLPGTRTRFARLVVGPDINGPGLIDSLLELRRLITSRSKPILFLTNDKMVSQVARHWDKLAPHYALSWQECPDRVAKLLSKSAVYDRCQEVGLNIPETRILKQPNDLSESVHELGFPVLAKPNSPLGAFKAKLVHSHAELQTLIDKYPNALPLIVQDWIPGGDEALYFCALYLENGKVLHHFTGHKLLSHPPALGQTTIAEPGVARDVQEAAIAFFENLRLSGPCSLEVKRDPSGDLWVIEPTVGRTDFWLPLCTANGVDFRLIEYRRMAGEEDPARDGRDTDARWFDTERDVVAYVRHLVHNPLHIKDKVVFPFLDWYDTKPFIAASKIALRNIVDSSLSKPARLFRRKARTD